MEKKTLIGAVLTAGMLAPPSFAIKLQDANIDFGIQDRVMYNNSNIGSEKQYDFFRQRLRLNLDVHTEDNVGGFIQIEYRGGWGGSSPGASDPRGVYNPGNAAFNRLQARGIRYGYLYFPAGPGKVMAGILPANDQVNQMLFSADWDLNVGGIAYAGKAGNLDWRVGFVRLIEGIALISNKNINNDTDENFIVLDVNTKAGGIDLGLHGYMASGNTCQGNNCTQANGPKASKLNQTWLGAHATASFGSVKVHGVVLYNSGEIGNTKNNGFLVRIEPSLALGKINLSLLGVYSTGTDKGEGFKTVHEILGTNGYWAYTYIFTPHGPSDVNDFGLRPDNKGYGLMTVQGKVDIPISKSLSAQAVAGLFNSTAKMPAGGGKTSTNLGTEVGAQLTANVGKHMNLEFGGAFASLGDAGKQNYQGNTQSSVNEIFARLQLEF